MVISPLGCSGDLDSVEIALVTVGLWDYYLPSLSLGSFICQREGNNMGGVRIRISSFQVLGTQQKLSVVVIVGEVEAW